MALLTCILRPETCFTANEFESQSPTAITANVSPSRVTGFQVVKELTRQTPSPPGNIESLPNCAHF